MNRIKKLKLSKRSLRRLADGQLSQVVGGNDCYANDYVDDYVNDYVPGNDYGNDYGGPMRPPPTCLC